MSRFVSSVTMCVMLVVWSGCEQDGDSGPKECSADWECNWLALPLKSAPKFRETT